eukprot:CAMPEP_0172663102 /NCGR_PEP_ID=MMETSP1074-20121228/5714_1 /TAXON_ID=2916 /ORGANISM="Ceratium fusus, Strain PA161109" /LENGTH=428 /DNA_ID=CAMNT_0013479049 /DNA_START=125 /DNA_END=1411 /DNA_ORIENTATION=-
MTRWTGHPKTFVGASCEYGNAAIGGMHSPAATSPYITQRAYCAVNARLYRQGAACGQCFRVSYEGGPATPKGKPGSLVVQVVNSGRTTFDCHEAAFKKITGSTEGIYPINFEPVQCETAPDGPVATVLDGDNAFYTKVIFSNLPSAVSGAKLKVGSKIFAMQRNSGATWRASTDGSHGAAASFTLMLDDGSTLENVMGFKSWPVKTGASCHGKAEAGSREDVRARSSKVHADPRLDPNETDSVYSNSAETRHAAKLKGHAPEAVISMSARSQTTRVTSTPPFTTSARRTSRKRGQISLGVVGFFLVNWMLIFICCFKRSSVTLHCNPGSSTMNPGVQGSYISLSESTHGGGILHCQMNVEDALDQSPLNSERGGYTVQVASADNTAMTNESRHTQPWLTLPNMHDLTRSVSRNTHIAREEAQVPAAAD